MKLKNLPYILVVLLLWGCVDDLVVSTSNNDPSDDVATSENDQYVSPRPVRSENDDTRLLGGSSLCILCISPSLPLLNRLSQPEHGSLGSTDPLYAFMSLQC